MKNETIEVRANTYHIKVSYPIMNTEGYLMGNGYENLCYGDENMVKTYEHILNKMRKSYFKCNQGGCLLTSVSMLTLSMLIDAPQACTKEQKDMMGIMEKIVSFSRTLNPKMTLAELLLGLEIII